MIKIPKKYIRLVSWADFLIILFFVLIIVFPILDLSLSLSNELLFSFVFSLPLLLILSSYILFKSKKKIEYQKPLCMLSLFIGIFDIILFLYTTYVSGVMEAVALLNLLGAPSILSTSFLLIISGFYLRKISK